MVLIALLVVAAAGVLIAVILGSVSWLVVSLVASVLAAVVLYRSWRTANRPTARRRSARRRATAGLEGRRTPQEGEPGMTGSQPTSPPVGGDTAGPGGSREVLVVDGYPDYHRPGCRTLSGLDAEPVALRQAVTDGFAPCQSCRPVPPQAVSDAEQVWVVDGYPSYHLAQCREVADLAVEPVPYEQALEDGFVPCPACDPDIATSTSTGSTVHGATHSGGHTASAGHAVAESATAVSTAQVWVVDGRPHYHAEHCLIIKGQGSEPIGRDEAISDGFAPCSLCQRDDSR